MYTVVIVIDLLSVRSKWLCDHDQLQVLKKITIFDELRDEAE